MENSNSSIGLNILIITDAWDQTNGVVTTLTNVITQLQSMGHRVKVLSHRDCDHTMQLPLYPEITLGWIGKHQMKKWCMWADCVHIATPEGPVGLRALMHCVKHDLVFTTGYHTKWPEFVKARLPVPHTLTYRWMRWLHSHSSAVLVPTSTVKSELESQGFQNLCVWTRGVDPGLFVARTTHSQSQTLTLLCVSRVSNEKGLDDFCALDTASLSRPVRKVLVGDGPYLSTLKSRYPDVVYLGKLTGHDLAAQYAAADVFVFPSRTDTFGVVMLESMSAGTPIAAYPVTGPVDVIESGINGFMHQDLMVAVEQCLSLDRNSVAKSSKSWSWQVCTQQFLSYLKNAKHDP